MQKAKSSYLYLGLTILIWSAVPAAAKLTLSGLDNYQLLFYTSVVSVVTLLLINLFQGKLGLLLKYTLKDYLIMLGMGALGFFLYYIFLYGSFSLAPAGQVNVMNYLWPIFIIIFSIPVLKEKANWKTFVAIALSFLGALVAFTKGDLSSFGGQYALGYLLAALAAVSYGLFSVFGKKLKYDDFSSLLVYNIWATILIIPTSLFLSGFVLPNSLPTLFSILFLGIFLNGLSYVFWFKAFKSGNTAKIANIAYIIPFLAMVWTYFLNKEPFSIFSIVGLVLIVGGIFIQLTNKFNKAE